MTKIKDDKNKYSAKIKFKSNQPLFVRFGNNLVDCIDKTRKLAPIKSKYWGKNLNILSLSDWQ